MSIFGPSKSQIESDRCLNDVLEFIKVALKIEPEHSALSTITVYLGNTIICEYAQFDEYSNVCCMKNLIFKGEVPVNGAKELLGKYIFADELPADTDIEFHMNEDANNYDYYKVKWSCTPKYNHSENKYMEVLLELLNQNNITVNSLYKKDRKRSFAIIKIKDFDN